MADYSGTPAPGFRESRDALLADHALTGSEWCRRYAEICDTWLREVFAAATSGDPDGVALLAVGGYGSGRLAPGSDLDLILVHDRKGRMAPVAEAVWYPVWNERFSLDHSVRTVKELRAAMTNDLRVALGVLDARLVAGDPDLAATAVGRVVDLWRTRTDRWLPQVAEAVSARHSAFGDVAFLLEPDLKEARGGTRDARLLQAVGSVSPVLAEVVAQPALQSSFEVLTAARVELQRATGRHTDRLLLQDQDTVAAALGCGDADDLMARVADAARAIAWASDDGWRRVASWLRGPRGREASADKPLEPGLVLRDGEVAIAATHVADAPLPHDADASLAVRAAACSAELDVPIARSTLDRLAAGAPAPEGVWPPELLRALLRLLGAGRPAIAAVEALDQLGIWVRLLPEWRQVRNRPQRNAYHRFTVDRHLLETAANASALVRRVTRPDLLLLGALLHDIGKGSVGDHTEQGMAITERVAGRLGLDPNDSATLVKLVELHLLLPDVATRRDLSDPVTILTVARSVGDKDTLDLLAALTEADSLATGPSAWGPWKGGLVASLVERVRGHLEDGAIPGPPALTQSEQELAAADRLTLVADGTHVTVAAPDKPGLLAVVAGVLALRGVTVRSARTRTEADRASGMAVLVFEVAPAFDALPDWHAVHRDLEAALDGRLPLAERLAEHERTYAARRRPSAGRAPLVTVDSDNSAASAATVIEVRSPDAPGVLYRITRAISATGLIITAALVSTIGGEVIDAFYLTTPEGDKLSPADLESAALEAAISASLSA